MPNARGEITVRIWKMGLLESYQRGCSLRYRWHWACRECFRTDGYGHPTWQHAQADAQHHVDQGH